MDERGPATASAPARPWAFEGLRRSVDSLQALGWIEAHIALGQALWWSCLLDETCFTDPGYEAMRDADGFGRVLPGLRYARNAMAHGAAPVRSLPTFSLTGDRQPYEWLPVDLLDLYAPPKCTRRTPMERATYAEAVAGRPLESPLQAALSWFTYVDARDWIFS